MSVDDEVANHLLISAEPQPYRHFDLLGRAILDVVVDDIVLEHLIRLGRVDAALNEVGRVVSELELRIVDLGVELQTPFGSVAVNALFVLVQQDDVLALDPFEEAAQFLDDLGEVGVVVSALLDPERKHTDVLAAHQLADLDQFVKLGELRLVSSVVVQPNLADRRAYRRKFDSCRVETRFDVPRELFRLVVGNVFAVDDARTQILLAELFDQRNLVVQLGTDLVVKTRNFDL